jgi:hypothetical protein
MAELDITFETLDEVSGLQHGYSHRLLGPRPCRSIGMVSLIPLLTTLGIKLIAVEDAEAIERLRPRLVPRKAAKPEVPHWRYRLHPPAL